MCTAGEVAAGRGHGRAISGAWRAGSGPGQWKGEGRGAGSAGNRRGAGCARWHPRRPPVPGCAARAGHGGVPADEMGTRAGWISAAHAAGPLVARHRLPPGPYRTGRLRLHLRRRARPRPPVRGAQPSGRDGPGTRLAVLRPGAGPTGPGRPGRAARRAASRVRSGAGPAASPASGNPSSLMIGSVSLRGDRARGGPCADEVRACQSGKAYKMRISDIAASETGAAAPRRPLCLEV